MVIRKLPRQPNAELAGLLALARRRASLLSIQQRSVPETPCAVPQSLSVISA
jgi:hypothetical protein